MSSPYVSGVITFPGITAPISMVATRVLGVKPSSAIIYAQPQGDSPNCTGTATFTWGTSSNLITWTNALCDSSSLHVSTFGHQQMFVIYDRRWRWAKGHPVTGAYNVRKTDGTVDATTQKTLAELATLLFTAMGETTADVSLITSTEYPMLILDRSKPADQLAQLLEPRGYVISLMADNTVKVWPKGTGATLPANDDLVNANLSVDPPELPAVIRVVCNRTLVQSMLKTVPVGLDTDGRIRLVNDLSYKPAGGWDTCKDWDTFSSLPTTIAQECAKLSVGKWYQVVSQADGTQDINYGGVDYCPGEITVTDVSQLLPLENMILDTAVDPLGKTRYKPAVVSGVYWGIGSNPLQNPPNPSNSPAFTEIKGLPWTLNREYGIVMFNGYIQKDNAGTKTFADIYLTCCYSIHDATIQVKDRYEVDRSLGGYGFDVREVEELQRRLIVTYVTNTSSVTNINDNKATVDTDAGLYLDAAQNSYATQNSNVLMYRDCYSFSTDGITLQLQWKVAVQGPVPFGTMASQYAENLYLLPTALQMAIERGPRIIGDPLNYSKARYNRLMYGDFAPRGGKLGGK